MTKALFQVMFDTRQMRKVMRLAVAQIQSREDPHDLRGALRAKAPHRPWRNWPCQNHLRSRASHARNAQ